MSVTTDFTKNLDDSTKTIADKVISIIESHNKKLGAAVKWRQLTFGLDNDFDHWVCAISATKKSVNLKFHFGNILDDKNKVFTPEDSKFIRKIEIASVEDIDDKAIKDLMDQAIQKLPYFKEHWKEIAQK